MFIRIFAPGHVMEVLSWTIGLWPHRPTAPHTKRVAAPPRPLQLRSSSFDEIQYKENPRKFPVKKTATVLQLHLVQQTDRQIDR